MISKIFKMVGNSFFITVIIMFTSFINSQRKLVAGLHLLLFTVNLINVEKLSFIMDFIFEYIMVRHYLKVFSCFL